MGCGYKRISGSPAPAAHDSHFTARVRWVQIGIDQAAEDNDHLISDEERLRIAMARQ